MRLFSLSAGLGLWLAGQVHGAEATWKAGVAKALITPTNALWMAGYASRNHPAQGKATELWTKALALEDAAGHRGVIVTCDLVGIKHPIYLDLCAALRQKFALRPEQFILAASHTHCGPLLRGCSPDTYAIDEGQRLLVEAYSTRLEETLVHTVGEALANLKPARLAAGQGQTGFAVNRRNNAEPDVPQLLARATLKGPVDHTVPVLAVYSPDEKLIAILFGYACHNTTMDFYQWCGDYAGFAQIALEKSHPEATALFFMGCGGDQNPLPRHQLALAEHYGNMLAAAVEEVLLAPPTPLPPELRTSFESISLPFGPPPTQAELEQWTTNSAPALRRWAARLLAESYAGRPFERNYPFPVQAWRLGGRQLLLTLGGEPVVDYALKFKNEFGPQTWVAGYCNEVMTYIPSKRVLDEDKPPLASSLWGYEGNRAMMFSGLPAFRWADDVEERINSSLRRVVGKVTTKP